MQRLCDGTGTVTVAAVAAVILVWVWGDLKTGFVILSSPPQISKSRVTRYPEVRLGSGGLGYDRAPLELYSAMCRMLYYILWYNK